MSTSPAVPAEPTPDVVPRWAWVLAALPVLFAFGLFTAEIVLGPLRVNHDVAQYLLAGQRVLAGERPFVDLIDTNPPLVLYLSAIPAALGALTGLPLALAGNVFWTAGVALLFFGVAAGLRLLAGAHTFTTAGALTLVAGGWVLVLYLSYARSGVLGLGQRDQIAGAALVVWTLARLARYEARPLAIGLAVFAGLASFVAVGMKPHYVAALAVVEGYLVLRSPRWPPLRSAEVYALAVACLVYALHFFVVPGMDTFYTHWIGYIAEQYDANYGTSLDAVLKRFGLPSKMWFTLSPFVPLVLCVLLMFWGTVSTDRSIAAAGALAAAALGCAATFLLQGKGFGYHRLAFDLAAMSALGVAAGALATRAVRRVSQPHATPPVLWATALGMLAVVPLVPGASSVGDRLVALREGAPRPDPLAEGLRDATRPGDRILPFTYAIPDIYPSLALSGRGTAGRYLNTFPFIFFYARADGYDDLGAQAQAEQAFYEDLVRDVRDQRPALIVAETRGIGLSGDLSSAGYLEWRGFLDTFRDEYVAGDTLGVFATFRRIR